MASRSFSTTPGNTRQYETDQNGNVYIDDLPEAGKYFIRELEKPGYVVDTELKTVTVEAGKVIETH